MFQLPWGSKSSKEMPTGNSQWTYSSSGHHSLPGKLMSREGEQTGGSSIFHISTFAATYFKSSHFKLQTRFFSLVWDFLGGKKWYLALILLRTSHVSIHVDSEQHCLDSIFTVLMVKSTCWELYGNSMNWRVCRRVWWIILWFYELFRVWRLDFENDSRSFLSNIWAACSHANNVSLDLMLLLMTLQVCPKGYLSLESGAGCRACPDGYSCDPRNGVQRSCNPGQYSPGGELECLECPESHVCPDGRSRQVQKQARYFSRSAFLKGGTWTWMYCQDARCLSKIWDY